MKEKDNVVVSSLVNNDAEDGLRVGMIGVVKEVIMTHPLNPSSLDTVVVDFCTDNVRNGRDFTCYRGQLEVVR